MHGITIFSIALALAMDAFAVAVAVAASVHSVTDRHIFRLCWHFGLFQFLMPIIGWSIGEGLLLLIKNTAPWVAFGLLCFLGLKMIWESGHVEAKGKYYDPTTGWSLIGLSVATSLDALAVGVSLALVQVSILRAAIIIGLVAFCITFVGVKVGNRIGFYAGKWAERAGGGVLIVIAFNVLLQR